MNNCIFCKIANKEIEKELLYEDDGIIAFDDIEPKAPVHVLIVPKKHIPSVNHLELEDKKIIGQLVLIGRKLAEEKGIAESGFRLIFNTGKDAGQTVEHLHLHLLGGGKLAFA